MVQVLPTGFEDLGPALQQFAKGVMDYIQPNRDLVKGMQQAMLTNPNLIQQLANIEAAAPGTMGNLGLGPLAGIVQAVPESGDAQFARENKDTISKAKKAELGASTATNQFTIDQVNELVNFLSDPKNKDVKADVILQKLTGQTAAGRQASQAQATSATAKAKVDEASVPGAIAQAELSAKVFDNAKNQFPLLKGQNVRKMVRDFTSGNLDAMQTAAIMATPGLSDAFKMGIQADQNEKEMAARQTIATMQLNNNKHEDNFQTQKAYQRYATTNAGTLDSWKEVLFGKGKERAATLRSKKSTDLTQEEHDLLETVDADERERTMELMTQHQRVGRMIAESVSNIGKSKGNEAQLQLNVANLNAALMSRRDLGMPEVTAMYGKIPDVGEKSQGTFDFNGKGLYFVDKDGVRVDDAEAVRMPDPNQKVADPLVMRAFGVIQGAPAGQRAAKLEELKRVNPEIHRQVVSLMNSMGTK